MRVPALLIIYSPNSNEPTMWPNHPEVERHLRRYLSLPKLEREKKAKDQETYMEERVPRPNASGTKGKFYHEFSNKEQTYLNLLLKEIEDGSDPATD